MINFEPITLREHIAAWLSLRIAAANYFVLHCMRTNPKTRKGNQDLNAAPTHWYIDRFCQGWKLGKAYIIRVRRELKRIYKV